MANQRLNIDIIANDKTKQAFGNLQKGLGRLKQSVFNLKNAFIGLGAGLVVRNLVNTGKEVENLRTRLKFLLKNTNEGAKAFENMSEFASRVPFSLEEISRGSGILATVTDNADDLQNMLEITGNVAAVTGLDFRTAAEQIQRSFSAGIGAADLFREKGVRNMLGFKAGATVSIEETVQAFERVFGSGGRFGKATDELAQTLEGTLSMLGDKVFAFKKTLLDAGFFSELKRQFGDLDKFLEKNSEQIEQIAIQVGTNLAIATIKAAEAIKLLANNFRDLQSVLGILLIALGGMLKILAGLGLIINDVERRSQALVNNFKKTAEETQKISDILSGVDANEGFVDTFKKYSKALEKIESDMAIKIPDATQVAINKFEQLNDEALSNLQNKLSFVKETIAEGINSGITKFSNALARAVILGEDLGKSFKRMLQDALVNSLAIMIEMVIRMGIQKLLGIELEKSDNNRLRTEKGITKEKQKQVALQAILVAMGGGGGGSGGGNGLFGFFSKGGSVPKGQPIVVGERGAELFIPNQAGQITQSARGTNAGGAVNVNFTINAVDTAGIDRLLVERRGTISRIINESVNERGSSNII